MKMQHDSPYYHVFAVKDLIFKGSVVVSENIGYIARQTDQRGNPSGSSPWGRYVQAENSGDVSTKAALQDLANQISDHELDFIRQKGYPLPADFSIQTSFKPVYDRQIGIDRNTGRAGEFRAYELSSKDQDIFMGYLRESLVEKNKSK